VDYDWYDQQERERRRRGFALERRHYTAFVHGLHPEIDERDLFELFSECGKISDINIIRDRVSGFSRGLAYVEFWDKNCVKDALALDGVDIRGYPLKVSKTVEENAGAAAPVAVSVKSGLHLNIYNVSELINLDDLKGIFREFGRIEMAGPFGEGADAHYTCRYLDPKEGTAAQTHLNGFDLDNKKLRLEVQQQAQAQTASSTAATTAASTSAAPAVAAPPSAGERGLATTYVLVANMFDVLNPAETQEHWKEYLAEDVTAECEGKLDARVKALHVDGKNTGGNVYIHFATVQGAQNVVKVFQGRWFAKRQLTATYLDQDEFDYMISKL
jgi:RNA-binding protein 39